MALRASFDHWRENGAVFCHRSTFFRGHGKNKRRAFRNHIRGPKALTIARVRSQACSFYKQEDRGCTDTEALIDALTIISSSDDDGVAIAWATDALLDGDGYADGEPWTMPSSWKSRNPRRHVVTEHDAFLKKARLTAGVLEAIAKAAAQYEGKGHTEVALPAKDLHVWLWRMLKPVGDKDVLLGMGGGLTTKQGAPLRKDYLVLRVARLLTDEDIEDDMEESL